MARERKRGGAGEVHFGYLNLLPILRSSVQFELPILPILKGKTKRNLYKNGEQLPWWRCSPETLAIFIKG
jgi:hypothetical protein